MVCAVYAFDYSFRDKSVNVDSKAQVENKLDRKQDQHDVGLALRLFLNKDQFSSFYLKPHFG